MQHVIFAKLLAGALQLAKCLTWYRLTNLQLLSVFRIIYCQSFHQNVKIKCETDPTTKHQKTIFGNQPNKNERGTLPLFKRCQFLLLGKVSVLGVTECQRLETRRVEPKLSSSRLHEHADVCLNLKERPDKSSCLIYARRSLPESTKDMNASVGMKCLWPIVSGMWDFLAMPKTLLQNVRYKSLKNLLPVQNDAWCFPRAIWVDDRVSKNKTPRYSNQLCLVL